MLEGLKLPKESRCGGIGKGCECVHKLPQAAEGEE